MVARTSELAPFETYNEPKESRWIDVAFKPSRFPVNIRRSWHRVFRSSVVR